jgi:hypothetical protein
MHFLKVQIYHAESSLASVGTERTCVAWSTSEPLSSRNFTASWRPFSAANISAVFPSCTAGERKICIATQMLMT